jgi:glutamate racemase
MQNLSSKPIGIFDSGLGGLTVVKELIKLLPHEDLIYLGDTARVPYGTRSVEIIRKFSEDDTKFLINKDVKLVVIACNTSSAVASKYLKNKFKNIPIFEVISSASEEAAKLGINIGVIGTPATVRSASYSNNIKKNSSKAKVKEVACPLFVPFIEEGEADSASLKLITKKYLSNLKKNKIDTLVMGCTHYPIIEDIISEEIGKNVHLVNPGQSVAKEVSSFLYKGNLLNDQKGDGKIKFFVTDLTERFTKITQMFLGGRIKGRINKVVLNP